MNRQCLQKKTWAEKKNCFSEKWKTYENEDLIIQEQKKLWKVIFQALFKWLISFNYCENPNLVGLLLTLNIFHTFF